MSWIDLLWPLLNGTMAALAAVQFFIWLQVRQSINLLLAISSAAAVAMGVIELRLMHATTPVEYATWLRWAHVPMTVLAISLIGFVHVHFRAGRTWLGVCAVALRLFALAANFSTGVGLNYLSPPDLSHAVLWSGSVATVPVGDANPWMIVGQLAHVVLIAYLLDAAWTLERLGQRRGALVVLSLGACMILLAAWTAMVVLGAVFAPLLFNPLTAFVVLAASYEAAAVLSDAHRSRQRVLAAQLEMIESRQRLEKSFEAVVEASPNALLVVDSAGRITYANAQAEPVFQYSRRELVGMAVDELVPERHRASHGRERDRYLEAGAKRAMGAARTLSGLRKDGSEVPLEIGLSQLRSGDEVLTLACVLDISDRLRAERNADRQRDEMAHLSRVALVSELSGSLAHEISQPPTAILSNAQVGLRFLASSPPDLEEVKLSLSNVVQSDKRAGEVIRRMRAMLRKEPMQRLPLDMADVVEEVAGILRADLINRGVDLFVEPSSTLPLVLGDRVQLQQVLLNLTMNAADAMKDQDAPRAVILRIQRVEHAMDVTVSDFGSGIPEDQLELIFEAFVTTKSEGLGLGLGICRTIAEAHGGSLVAFNNPGRGASLRMRLPEMDSRAIDAPAAREHSE